MKRSHLAIVAIALVLLALSFWASRQDDDATREAQNHPDANRTSRVEYPRDRPVFSKPRRRTQGDAPLDTTRSRRRNGDPRDVLELAIADPEKDAHVVVELNAIRNTPIVEKLLRCEGDDTRAGLEDIKKATGIDPEQDVDRVAITDGVLAVSGFFDKLTPPEELGDGTPYGDDGHLFNVEGEKGTLHMARLGSHLVLMGKSEAEVMAAIDRAEGRGTTSAPPPIDGALGEIYGHLDADAIGRLLGDTNSPVARRVAELVKGGDVRVNVDENLALSLDLEAPDAATSKDLSRAVAGAIAGARLEATTGGDEDLARLLDFARVAPGEDGKFAIDVAVPSETLLDLLGCDAEGNKRPGTESFMPSDRGAPAAGNDEAPPSDDDVD